MAKKLKELLVDELRHEVAELRTIIMAKDKQILDLTTKVQDLEDKADDVEQYSRRNSLRISGIPEREAGGGRLAGDASSRQLDALPSVDG